MKKGIIVILIVGIILSVSTVGAYLYTASNVTYSNSNLSATNTQKAIEELYDKACPSNAICEWKKSWSQVAVGDYVRMTPTKSSYTTDTSKTGYTSTQTIYPQELKLWRVIKTSPNIELVSEYVSSTNVYFTGATGYANFVGYLNTLASQYENSTYTSGSRYMGYNGQTQTITNTAAFNGSSNSALWTSSTTSTANTKATYESTGQGDTLYTTDTNLVKAAYGNQGDKSLVAKKCNDTTCSNPSAAQTYWLASRYYYYGSSTSFYFDGRMVSSGGSISSNFIRDYMSGWKDAGYSCNALRPILTLKSGLSVSDALGTKEHPFILG
jgi:hypothetical protein